LRAVSFVYPPLLIHPPSIFFLSPLILTALLFAAHFLLSPLILAALFFHPSLLFSPTIIIHTQALT